MSAEPMALPSKDDPRAGARAREGVAPGAALMGSAQGAPGQADSPGIVVSYEDAAEEMGVSLRHVRRLVRDGRLPALPLGRHENGRVAYGVPAAALRPAPAPGAPLAGGIEGSALGATSPSALPSRQRAPVAERIPLTADGIPDVAACRAMGLDSHVEEWDRRMRMVGELLEARTRHGQGRAVVRFIAEKWGVSTPTAYRRLQAYCEGGPLGVFPAWDGGRGETTLPPDLQLQVREFWLNSRKTSFKQVYRSVVLPWYRERGQDPVAYSTVRRYLQTHVLPLEEIFWREGRQAYRAGCEPKVARDLAALKPNDWWVADHRLWDVLVVVADGRGAGWGKHATRPCVCGSGRQRRECCSLRRPWVTMIADVATAAFVGRRIGLVPTAAGVCHAVRQAILSVGAPEHWYRDNGKEFTANRLGGDAARCRSPRQADVEGRRTWPCALPEEVEGSGIWAALGIEVVTAIPFSPWSKPIESLFGAWAGEWENYAPGWTGHDAHERPEQLERQIENGQLLTWAEFCGMFDRKLDEWNRYHACGERSAPPLGLYADALKGGWEPRRVDPQALTVLLQDRGPAHVATDGITLQAGGVRHRFWSEALALYVGCEVERRWDPEDPACVWAYAPDGTVLCVPRDADAEWGRWGEVNEGRKRAARSQREYLAARRAEVEGSTPMERLDPTGAVALIQARLAAVAAGQREAQAAEAAAGQLAEEQAAARRLAAERESKRPRERARTVYSDLLEEIAG